MRKNILLVNIVGETSNYLSATLVPLTMLGETLHPSSPDGPNLLPDKSILSYGARRWRASSTLSYVKKSRRIAKQPFGLLNYFKIRRNAKAMESEKPKTLDSTREPMKS